MQNEFDLAIIGAGPAGYSAAIYASRAGLKVGLWTGMEIGGQLMTTNEVENFLGFPEGILGPEFMERSKKQAERFGTKIIMDTVISVEKNDKGFKINANREYGQVKSVILATGAHAKWLNIESEEKFKGRGVSACATCDGFFFKNKKVVVVGAGDVAMEDAQTLSNYASSVTVLVRKSSDKVRASQAMYQRALKNPKINFLYNTEVIEFLGNDKLEKIKIINNQTQEVSEIEIEGVFIAIGHQPNTENFKKIIDCDDDGYIITDGVKTNISGIFAAGDVMDKIYRQAITSAGTGCMAALEAKNYIDNL